MQLTRFSDYGLRVMMYLATHPEQRVSAGEIASAYSISTGHVAKVVHLLAAEGFVETRRGRDGGIELARSAGSIGLGELLRATELGAPLVECFDRDTNACPVAGACGLERSLHRAQRAFFASLDESTLADVVRTPKDFISALSLSRQSSRASQSRRTMLPRRSGPKS